MAVIAPVNTVLSGILNGIAKAALNQTPSDLDTFADIQQFIQQCVVSWPAYTVTATTSTTGPLNYVPQIAGAATGTSWVNPAQNVTDSVTAAVKQTSINPKSLGV